MALVRYLFPFQSYCTYGTHHFILTQIISLSFKAFKFLILLLRQITNYFTFPPFVKDNRDFPIDVIKSRDEFLYLGGYESGSSSGGSGRSRDW